MKRFTLIALLLIGSSSANADVFHTLVGVKCNPLTDRLIVYYVGAYNDYGEAMTRAKTPNEFSPWDLTQPLEREVDEKGRISWDRVLRVTRNCQLTHGNYTVRLGARGGNGMGACQADPTTIVEIRRDGVVVVPRRSFEPDDCHAAQATFLVRVTIDTRSPRPRLEEMPSREFLK